MENRANKKITTMILITIMACIVPIIAPLVPIKEFLSTQTPSVNYYYPTKTKLKIKKWTVSESYSAEREVIFYPYTTDEETIIFTKTGISSGIFNFIPETDGWNKKKLDFCKTIII